MILLYILFSILYNIKLYLTMSNKSSNVTSNIKINDNISSNPRKRKFDEISDPFTDYKLPKINKTKINDHEYLNDIFIEYNEYLTMQLK